MRKKLSAFFDNEDEALDAVTKLRAANIKIIGVETVDEAGTSQFIPSMPTAGSIYQTPYISPNIFYPFESFEEEFAMFEANMPYMAEPDHGKNSKMMVRFSVKRAEMDKAMDIIKQSRGRL